MKHPFIVYLKNKASLNFEYRRDVSMVVRTDNGYRITFNNGKSYNYGADKVKYYPLISTLNIRHPPRWVIFYHGAKVFTES